MASVNLGRLAERLNIDVLSASLGLSEPVLNKIIQGLDVAEDYQIHIESRFKEAGVPIAWLRQPDMNMRGDYLSALGNLAATSTNKAPTRRHNFQTLVNAFNGQTALVAEILDMVEASVRGVYDGRLELSDERFTHLNPRLMRAGFPNGWLDKAGATFDNAWLPQLEALVTADEQEAEEMRAADAARRLANPPAAPTSTDPAPETSNEVVAPAASSVAPEPAADASAGGVVDVPVAADAPAAVEGQSLVVSPARPVLSLPLHPPSATISTEQGNAGAESTDSRQQALFDATHANASQAASSAEPSTTPTSPPALAGSTQDQDIPKEMTSMATAQKPSSAKPTAGTSRPTQATRLLPRGAMGAGRSIGRSTAAPSSAPAGEAAPAGKKPGKTVVVKPNAAGAKSAAAPKEAPQSRVKTPSSSAALSRADVPNTRAGKTPVTKTVSMARAAALEQVLETARRGVKSALWVHLLGESLALGGNMRRGTNLLRDETADKITEHLGLPQGFLDNPTFPPPTLAEWVTNSELPLPGDAENPRRLGRPPKNSKTPFARTPAPEPTAQIGASAPAPASTQAPAAPTQAPAPAPAVALVAAPTARAAAPQPGPVTAGTGTFTWTPSEGSPVSTPSPLMQALALVLNQSAQEGRFTDTDARRLIAMLTTA